jgi:hypothetical protein
MQIYFALQNQKSMKTIIVNVPDNEEEFFLSFFRKNKLKSRVLSQEDREEFAISKWINEGFQSEDVPVEKIYEHFRKHGVNC